MCSQPPLRPRSVATSVRTTSLSLQPLTARVQRGRDTAAMPWDRVLLEIRQPRSKCSTSPAGLVMLRQCALVFQSVVVPLPRITRRPRRTRPRRAVRSSHGPGQGHHLRTRCFRICRTPPSRIVSTSGQAPTATIRSLLHLPRNRPPPLARGQAHPSIHEAADTGLSGQGYKRVYSSSPPRPANCAAFGLTRIARRVLPVLHPPRHEHRLSDRKPQNPLSPNRKLPCAFRPRLPRSVASPSATLALPSATCGPVRDSRRSQSLERSPRQDSSALRAETPPHTRVALVLRSGSPNRFTARERRSRHVRGLSDSGPDADEAQASSLAAGVRLDRLTDGAGRNEAVNALRIVWRLLQRSSQSRSWDGPRTRTSPALETGL